MIDLFHIPTGDKNDVQMFWPNQLGDNSIIYGWQTWTKPRGFTMAHIIAIGSGGGGGGGAGAAAGAGKGGGGGGAAGAISTLVIPLRFLPDHLYLNVAHGGRGGNGGSSGNGTAGQNGGHVRVAVYPNGTVQNLILQAGANPSNGGNAGTTAAGGTGGSANSAVSASNIAFLPWGTYTLLGSLAGSNGGASAGAAGQTNSLFGAILSGCGGGGSTSADFAGGGYAAIANTPFLAVDGGPAGSNPGSGGFRHSQFPVLYGGTGGGSSNSTTGGAGGAGVVPGAGGGGGGGGVTTGGRGGDGGPGLVMIICY